MKYITIRLINSEGSRVFHEHTTKVKFLRKYLKGEIGGLQTTNGRGNHCFYIPIQVYKKDRASIKIIPHSESSPAGSNYLLQRYGWYIMGKLFAEAII